MTDKQRVFCKDCRWLIECTNKIDNICNRHGETIITYDPVYGEENTMVGTCDCYDKNANCDCQDYEVKDDDT